MTFFFKTTQKAIDTRLREGYNFLDLFSLRRKTNPLQFIVTEQYEVPAHVRSHQHVLSGLNVVSIQFHFGNTFELE